MSPRKSTTKEATHKSKGFSDEEKAAMKARVQELKVGASTSPSTKGKSPSQLADARIKELKERGDWRGKKLSQLRAVIKQADPAIVEEVKWKKTATPWESLSGLMTESYVSEIRSRTP